MSIVFLVVIVFSILILVHEAGHLVVAKRLGVSVKVFSLGFGKRLCGFNAGGTDYRISLVPFGGYVKMSGEDPSEATGAIDEFGSKPAGHRFWIVTAGALMNYFFAFILFSVIHMMGLPTLSNEVGSVLKGYPAESAGIQIKDKILSIDDEEVKYWDDIVEIVRKKSRDNAVLDVKIERENAFLHIEVKPAILNVKNIFGQTVSHPAIGITPRDKILSVSYSPLEAVYLGGKKLIMLTGMTYKGIWLLVTGALPLKTSVSGPIGIAHLVGEAAKLGIIPFLVIIAHVSMALAIFNLLPFPILDGGHIIFLTLEKIRGRALSIKVQEVITHIAFAVLIAFMLFVSWQDIVKFTPFGR